MVIFTFYVTHHTAGIFLLKLWYLNKMYIKNKFNFDKQYPSTFLQFMSAN